MHSAVSSGTGPLQLLSFTHDASSDAIRLAAEQMGYTAIALHGGTVVEATAYLAQHPSPQALLVELTSQEQAAAQLDALADLLQPTTRVIVCGTIDSVRFYHWLLDIGIHEYLLQPFTETELVQALRAESPPVAHTDATAPAPKMIALIGARGGVGTTTLAVTAASMLARRGGAQTALFDADSYFGAVALTLDIEAGRGLRDALEKPERVDALFLERVMAAPLPRLSVLSAEEPLQDILHPHEAAGETILAALRSRFGFVVVDLPRQMNPLTRHVLAHADHVLVVADPQLGSLRDALRLKDYLVDGLKRPAPMLLLNRIGMVAKHALSVQDFTRHYGQAPALQLPYLTDIIAAGADGTLLLSHPKLSAALAPFEALIGTLSGLAAEDTTSAAAGRSLLARFTTREKRA